MPSGGAADLLAQAQHFLEEQQQAGMLLPYSIGRGQ